MGATTAAAVYRVLSAETGVYIDTAAAVSRIGPPLEDAAVEGACGPGGA